MPSIVPRFAPDGPGAGTSFVPRTDPAPAPPLSRGRTRRRHLLCPGDGPGAGTSLRPALPTRRTGAGADQPRRCAPVHGEHDRIPLTQPVGCHSLATVRLLL